MQDGDTSRRQAHRRAPSWSVLYVTNCNAARLQCLTLPFPDWFDVLDQENRPVLTEREILRNLQAIVADADQLPVHEVAKNSIGVLSTENRKVWSSLRKALMRNRNNESCLDVIDNALFVVCLDDAHPDNLAELCNNFLCGTYELKGGVQIGTCTNRWYDKVRFIFVPCVPCFSWLLRSCK